MSFVVEIVGTGDELMSGQVADTNSAWIMDRLWDLGVLTARVTLVGDDRAQIRAAVEAAASRADAVVVSGGLGPTEDDLTAECVAASADAPLELHEPSLRAIEAFFAKVGREMTPNNRKQALVPRGAEVLPNRRGTAPGFALRVGRADVVCLPGVPAELMGLFDDAVLPRWRARLGPTPAARVVKLFGVAESHADQRMRPIMDDPSNASVRFGYRAHWPEVHVKWTAPPPDADARADRILARVRELFGDAVWGEGKAELPEVVVERLRARGERVAVAESCTGGLLASLVASVPGASGVFDLGVVVYADAMKSELLGVPATMIALRGAVSEPVARALAEGVRALGRATFGVGVTGIAGPTGGTPDKPVGTVHLALAGPSGTSHLERSYRGDRERIQRQAAYEALDLLRRATR